jgi:hypothetical protein
MTMRTLLFVTQIAVRRLGTAERGQTLAETALVLSFVTLVVILALLMFGPGVSGLYERFFDEYPG